MNSIEEQEWPFGDPEKCRRAYSTDNPPEWECVHKHRECMYNENNICTYAGFDTSPMSEDCDELEWRIAWWAEQAKYHEERGDIIPDSNPDYFNDTGNCVEVENMISKRNFKRYLELIKVQGKGILAEADEVELQRCLLCCPSYIRALALAQLIKEIDGEFWHNQEDKPHK